MGRKACPCDPKWRPYRVESRWTLDPSASSGAVVEINAPSSDSQPNHKTGSSDTNARSRGKIGNLLRTTVRITFLSLAIFWVFYTFFGRGLIRTMYRSDWIANESGLMTGTKFHAGRKLLLAGRSTSLVRNTHDFSAIANILANQLRCSGNAARGLFLAYLFVSSFLRDRNGSFFDQDVSPRYRFTLLRL